MLTFLKNSLTFKSKLLYNIFIYKHFILFLSIEMKKLLRIMLFWMFSIALSAWLASAASSDCLNLRFNNWDSVCLGITKGNSRNFKLSVDQNNLSKWGSIRCYVVLPNSSLYSFNNCEWVFSYAGTSTDDVIISATYIMRNGDFYSKRVGTELNFNKGVWWERNDTINSKWSSNSKSNSKTSNDLEITVSPSSPDTYEWVKVKIETDDDYVGRIDFSKLQYKSTSSSSWTNISMTSSTYVSDYSTAWSNGYYRMTSSDDGVVVLNNLVKFEKSGYYRLYVEDIDGNESYVQINVDTSSSSSSSSSDEIELSTNRKSPSTSQYVNLTIETDDDYSGRLSLSAKYRSSSSSNWSSISNTSSTYFTAYSDAWEDGYYRMTSSDDGEVTLNNLVKFRKDGYYRIYVEDTKWNESYIQFSVGDVDEDNDNSKVSWFSTSEYSKIKDLYKDWDDTLWQLQRKYPSLKKDTYWQRLSDTLYNNMKDVVNDKSSRTFDDYDDFLKAFNSWYKYTMQNV